MAYSMRYADGSRPMLFSDPVREHEKALDSLGMAMLNQIGLDAFSGGLPIFVPVSSLSLYGQAVRDCEVDPSKVVLTFSGYVPNDGAIFDKCNELAEKGFRFAFENVENPDGLMQYAMISDYAFIDLSSSKQLTSLGQYRRDYPHIKFSAKNVMTLENFENARKLPFDMFEGRFYSRPITKGLSAVSPLKANVLRLLNIVSDEDFPIEEVAKLIQQDTSLSVSLLRMINSPVIGLSQQVSSITQAVALLGQREIRKWVMVSVSALLGDDRPNEITRLSLIRAKFAEFLAGSFEMAVHSQSLFLAGLFSVLDIILQMPMELALKEVMVSDDIRDALVGKRGRFYDVLELIYAYEYADWEAVSRIMIRKGIGIQNVNQAFVDSLIWYRDLINYAMSGSDKNGDGDPE